MITDIEEIERLVKDDINNLCLKYSLEENVEVRNYSWGDSCKITTDKNINSIKAILGNDLHTLDSSHDYIYLNPNLIRFPIHISCPHNVIVSLKEKIFNDIELLHKYEKVHGNSKILIAIDSECVISDGQLSFRYAIAIV